MLKFLIIVKEFDQMERAKAVAFSALGAMKKEIRSFRVATNDLRPIIKTVDLKQHEGQSQQEVQQEVQQKDQGDQQDLGGTSQEMQEDRLKKALQQAAEHLEQQKERSKERHREYDRKARERDKEAARILPGLTDQLKSHSELLPAWQRWSEGQDQKEQELLQRLEQERKRRLPQLEDDEKGKVRFTRAQLEHQRNFKKKRRREDLEEVQRLLRLAHQSDLVIPSTQPGSSGMEDNTRPLRGWGPLDEVSSFGSGGPSIVLGTFVGGGLFRGGSPLGGGGPSGGGEHVGGTASASGGAPLQPAWEGGIPGGSLWHSMEPGGGEPAGGAPSSEPLSEEWAPGGSSENSDPGDVFGDPDFFGMPH